MNATIRTLHRSLRRLKCVVSVRKLSSYSCLRQKVECRAEFSNGRILVLESGGLARLADGAAVARLGDTSVLITAVSKGRPPAAPPLPFLPLTVDYRQKYAAAGRIPSNFLRRETSLTEKEILTSRIIDRSVRPLFPEGFAGDTQLSCQLLAVDGLHDPDVVSINAASAALAVSDIPWGGPVGAVRVGLVEGEVVVQPTRRELSHSSLNLVVTATEANLLVMLEGSGNNVVQQDLMKAVKVGVREAQHVVRAVQSLARQVGRPKRSFTNHTLPPEAILCNTRSLSETRLRNIFTDFCHNKLSRDEAVSQLRADVVQKVVEGDPHTDPQLASLAFSHVSRQVFRDLILDEGIRCDGRGQHDLRRMECGVDLFRPLHGSALFQRGQTQVQCTVAFDAPENIPKLDPLLEATGGYRDRNFLLHYSFPSFATNDVARSGGLSRREVGHGALAEKALRPLLPHDFPFAILLTSTVLESNGSSSMATVCGGSLALMDAGVELVAPAAGVAVGLVTRHDDDGKLQHYQLLTDILGIEDYLGDMDFKLAGTSKGFTALQADIKVPGVPLKVIMEAIQHGWEGKATVLALMSQTLSRPRRDQGKARPAVDRLSIPPHKRGRVMGLGGTTLRRIQAETGVQLTWEEQNQLCIFAPNAAALEEAKVMLEELLEDAEPALEFGGIYTATVVEVRQQGVMVTLYPHMNPVLLHNSQLDTRKVQHPSALGMEIGQQFKVKYFGRDPASGQMRLSRRALQATAALAKNLHKTDQA